MISKLKYTLLAMMLAAFVAQPALASTLNNDDMAFAFGDSPAVSSDLGEMALLSDQEMRDTEGKWWFAPALVGGTFGSAAYVWSTPNWTWGGVGRAFGAGATAGIWSVTPINWVARAGLGAFGAASWYRW